jgi:D-3-phosphoglycerate dehydrogenase
MKIFILDSFHPAGVEYASKHAEIVRWDDPRVKNWPEEADAVMVRGTKIREADLARAKKLKIISSRAWATTTSTSSRRRSTASRWCAPPA